MFSNLNLRYKKTFGRYLSLYCHYFDLAKSKTSILETSYSNICLDNGVKHTFRILEKGYHDYDLVQNLNLKIQTKLKLIMKSFRAKF